MRVAVAVLTGGVAVAAAGTLGVTARIANFIGATIGSVVADLVGAAAQAAVWRSTYGGWEVLTDSIAGALRDACRA